MPSPSDDAAGEPTGSSDAATTSAPDAEADAAAALSAAIDARDGDPECDRCSKPADYFLYEPGRVETFVCWEHVSPFSAAVDDPEDARPGRPLALSL
ncbi:hypothetical protein [Halobacterium jilantaiense]|uniref:Uncharacterized protein n=1 Tax=Halobacterium jilantaiense TaxID=355548 RepID=A0A1I0QGM1_9EURY|nr:hypothetical protein [Halobacterium jilantaiense]SEW26182.1 hypothetical protein SAMN04487945_2592 [Halobacterium jilantaiense]